MDKDRFTSLVSEPKHPIHAATAYMAYTAMLENRKKQKATGRIRAFGLIVGIIAAVVAIFAISYSF